MLHISNLRTQETEAEGLLQVQSQATHLDYPRLQNSVLIQNKRKHHTHTCVQAKKLLGLERDSSVVKSTCCATMGIHVWILAPIQKVSHSSMPSTQCCGGWRWEACWRLPAISLAEKSKIHVQAETPSQRIR